MFSIWCYFSDRGNRNSLSMWVCETYVVHHFNDTELLCAPLTMVHKGTCFFEFTAIILKWCTRARTHTYKQIQIVHTSQGSRCSSERCTDVVHNVALYWLGGADDDFYVISYHQDGAQYDVVSLDVCVSVCPLVSHYVVSRRCYNKWSSHFLWFWQILYILLPAP